MPAPSLVDTDAGTGDKSRMSTIPTLIAQFESLGGRQGFDFGAKAPPVPEARVAELEARIERVLHGPLPDGFKEFHRLTNGWSSIDGRYMDLFPLEQIATDLEDAKEPASLLVGSSGQNDFYVFFYPARTTGADACFLIEDWFEEASFSETDLAGFSAAFQQRVKDNAASAAEEGKYISGPLTFVGVLEHLLRFNATEV